MSFHRVEEFLQHGWDLLQTFYEWQVRQGLPALEAGQACKNLAYFQEMFLARFCFSPPERQVALDQIGVEILDSYLGGWYLTDSRIASAEDLVLQLGAFRRLLVFLRTEGLYRDSVSMCRAAEDALGDRERYLRRLRDWETLQDTAAGEADWIQRRSHWLESRW